MKPTTLFTLAVLIWIATLTSQLNVNGAGFFRQPRILVDTDAESRSFADCSAVIAFRPQSKMTGQHWEWTAAVGDFDLDGLPDDVRLTLIKHTKTHVPQNGEVEPANLRPSQIFTNVCPLPNGVLFHAPPVTDFGPHPGGQAGHHDFLLVRFDDTRNGRIRMSVILSHSANAPAPISGPMEGEVAAVDAPPVQRVADNGEGTIYLPPDVGPVGDGYVSVSDFHLLEAGDMGSVELDANHKTFRCLATQGPIDEDCIVDSTPDDPTDGEEEEFDSDLEFSLRGTGELEFLIAPRTLVIPVRARVKSGPRFPGQPVQQFDTEVVSFEGQLLTDSIFSSLKVLAGSAHGLPSPGRTILTQEGTNFLVHSYFSINYRIEWQGKENLAALSGTNIGVVLMELGRAAAPVFLSPPGVVGVCPPALGASVEVKAQILGESPMFYQWYRNNELIPGATGETHRIAAFSPGDVAEYSVRVENDGGSLVSPNVRVEFVSPSFTSIGLLANGSIQIKWNCGGMLESADILSGPYTQVPGATSPYEVPASTAVQKYYRLRQ